MTRETPKEGRRLRLRALVGHEVDEALLLKLWRIDNGGMPPSELERVIIRWAAEADNLNAVRGRLLSLAAHLYGLIHAVFDLDKQIGISDVPYVPHGGTE